VAWLTLQPRPKPSSHQTARHLEALAEALLEFMGPAGLEAWMAAHT
jgi:hypothetical protein